MPKGGRGPGRCVEGVEKRFAVALQERGALVIGDRFARTVVRRRGHERGLVDAEEGSRQLDLCLDVGFSALLHSGGSRLVDDGGGVTVVQHGQLRFP